MDTLAIIGGGSWGTALAVALAPRFKRVRLWFHDPGLATAVEAARENHVFLPGIKLPSNTDPLSSLDAAVSGAHIIIGVMPSHAAREVYRKMTGSVAQGTPIISATKGLDAITLMRISQVIEEEIPGGLVCALSGPSFAREVAEGKPTALVCAGRQPGIVSLVQERFSTPALRIYSSPDPAGVELGGALKNVIAIAAGMCSGLGLGHNALAALITRGLAEITRLAVACGAAAETLAGLAGLGDLVLTCTSDMSRNRQVGLKLASGASLDGIVSSTPMVAEGVRTAGLALQLAQRHGIEMPITAEMQAVMNAERRPQDAIFRLMTRSLKHETGADRRPGRNYS